MLDWFAKRLGVYELLPKGPVIGPWQRSRTWIAGTTSGADYLDSGGIDVGFPILPVIPFGLAYDLDLVIVSTHPEWNMHEYAMVRTPGGPVWLCKDAREGTRDQSIVADISDIDAWMPEVPVARKRFPVKVTDRSTSDRVDVALDYENLDGVPVSVHMDGPAPITAERKRNGSTMGHSRAQLMAVLDLSHKEHASRSEVHIDGVHFKTKRLLGLLPFHFSVVQTQGGLCVGSFVQSPSGRSFASAHPTEAGEPATQRWELDRDSEAGVVVARQRANLRTLEYRFVEAGEDLLELSTVSAFQWGRAAPTFHMALQPALPDLRRPFEGEVRCRFVVDVNGQENLAVGSLTASWEGDRVRARLRPRAPWWVTDRPMDTLAWGHEDHVHVEIERVAPG